MAVLLVVAIVLSLALPWYPVVRNHAVTQIFTYTYQVPTVSYQTPLTVYTLSAPVTLQGLFESGATLSQVVQDVGDVNLMAGSMVEVTATQCQYCSTTLTEDFGSSQPSVFAITGSGDGHFIVADAGEYKISVGNVGTSQDQISSIVITESMQQNTQQDETGNNVVSYTTYNTTLASPISILASGQPSDFTNFYLLLALLAAALCATVAFPILGLYIETEPTVQEPEIAEEEAVEKNTGSEDTKTVETMVTPSKTSMFCKECGAKIPRDSKFCKECGSKQP